LLDAGTILGRGQRAVPLDVGDEQTLAAGISENRPWIPARRNEALQLTFFRPASRCIALRRSFAETDNRNTVIGAVGNIEHTSARSQGNGVAAAAERQALLRPAANRLDNLVFHRVDDRDRIAVGIGNVDQAAEGAGCHAAGMDADADRFRLLPALAPLD